MRITLSQFAELRPNQAAQLKREVKAGQGKLHARLAAATGIGASIEASSGNAAENLLYSILEPVYGSLDDGGDLIRELIPLRTRAFRLDMALPRFKVGIELDGYKDHGEHIAGFVRDREKCLHLVAAGWLVIPCMYKHAKEQPELVLAAVSAAVARSVANNNFRIDNTRSYPAFLEPTP